MVDEEEGIVEIHNYMKAMGSPLERPTRELWGDLSYIKIIISVFSIFIFCILQVMRGDEMLLHGVCNIETMLHGESMLHGETMLHGESNRFHTMQQIFL